MLRPAHLAAVAAAGAIAASALPAQAQFALGTGYPRREGVSGRIVADSPFNINSPNVGFNRADCFDTKQKVLLLLANVPGEATTVQIWARRDKTSCADPTQRSGTGATTPQCWKVASWSRDEVWNKQVSFAPIQVIQAIDKQTNVEDPSTLDAATVCDKTASMPPTEVWLQIMAMNGDRVVGFGGTGTTTGGSAEQIIGVQTLYDIAGPNAPTGVTVEAGNTILIANYTSTAQSTSDFKGFRAYCFPKKGAASAGLSTKAGDGGLDVLEEDTAVGDAASDDTGAAGDGDVDAGTEGDAETDAGTTGGERPAGCPANDPFEPGKLPGPELSQYQCSDESAPTGGEITISGLTNEVAYAVALGTTDRQGNSGPLSEVACGMPKQTDDFYTVYRRAGGGAGGGWFACSMGTGAKASFGLLGSAFVFAVAARLARRARPRR
ncbi:MAG: hypothetical protein HYV09_26120 [Deltaproteobacteria bacterium]|nr:hypothetical protein [Deltaproteobacteria bacterium]